MRTAESNAFVSHSLIYALVAICFSGSIGLGTVWMRHQISIVANENKTLVASLSEANRQIEETSAAISAEQDPSVLNRRNMEWSLRGLVAPAEAQVRRVNEDPVMHLATEHNRTLFGDHAATVSYRVALAH